MMPVHGLADGTGPMPGDRTVGHVCSVCHGAGLLGAPKIGDASAWQARLKRAGSVDKLVDSAAHGRGNMPPRGGQSKLTDQDLKAAIQYMLSKSGDY
ncbi:MAG: c-type cytochrome [Stenotrophobium sp.]